MLPQPWDLRESFGIITEPASDGAAGAVEIRILLVRFDLRRQFAEQEGVGASRRRARHDKVAAEVELPTAVKSAAQL